MSTEKMSDKRMSTEKNSPETVDSEKTSTENAPPDASDAEEISLPLPEIDSKDSMVEKPEDKTRRRGLTSWGDVVYDKVYPDDEPVVSPYSMTEDRLKVRGMKADHGHFFKQLYVCLTVTMGSISAGYTIGSISPKIRQQYNLVHGRYDPEHARFATIVSMGLASGNAIMSILSMARGPRKIMLISAPFNIMCWTLMPIMHTPAYNKACMFFCAFLSVSYLRCGDLLLRDGIHEAYYFPMFLLFRSGYGFGIMLGYILGNQDVSYIADGFGACTALGLFAALFYCPESPVYIYRNSPLKAQKALIFYRGTEDIQVLMRQIAKDHEARVLSVSTKYMFFYSVVYRSIFIILTLGMLQCFYGYSIFLMYNVSLWYTSNKYKQVDTIGQREDAIILGMAYYIVPFIAESVNLKMTYGLKKPIMMTAVTAPCALVLHSLFYYVLFHTDYLLNMHWLTFVVRILHIICVNFGHTTSLEAMIASYLPEQVQDWVIIGIFTARYSMLSFLFWFTFMIENLLGASWIIGIFAMVSFAGIPFCHYFIIESKGRTLQQVQLAMGGNPIGTRNTFGNRYENYQAERMRKQEEERIARMRMYRDF